MTGKLMLIANMSVRATDAPEIDELLRSLGYHGEYEWRPVKDASQNGELRIIQSSRSGHKFKDPDGFRQRDYVFAIMKQLSRPSTCMEVEQELKKIKPNYKEKSCSSRMHELWTIDKVVQKTSDGKWELNVLGHSLDYLKSNPIRRAALHQIAAE